MVYLTNSCISEDSCFPADALSARAENFICVNTGCPTEKAMRALETLLKYQHTITSALFTLDWINMMAQRWAFRIMLHGRTRERERDDGHTDAAVAGPKIYFISRRLNQKHSIYAPAASWH